MGGQISFGIQIAHHFLHYGHYHVSLIPEAYIFSKVIISSLFVMGLT